VGEVENRKQNKKRMAESKSEAVVLNLELTD